ncbi:SAM-dependent methyltransferase [Mariniblastus fucicola]|uniref:Cyclopropane-fatty-acyl-phospholipid synthase n=1 Tax=Mariniblastus fucicola TaxID=980251 RepID=A0A5B9PFI7_9BACT|nr:cyclopropane-fatty-acyl-phospholipid synthase family protein [Mariniblastus fucicola]QEG21721.1 Cyclopropane-fatty-acyl-phospholipid synthase [Mariniblastus fucicola]
MLTKTLINACELGFIPDAFTRRGIRGLLQKRLAAADRGSVEANEAASVELAREFSDGPVALVPEKANEQHYEVPAELYGLMLGPHRKYSSCFWDDACRTLEEAESAALQATCDNAELVDGQSILELGCGWGSLTLWMAAKYPNSKITAVSNSASQREYITALAAERGVADRVSVLTCDMNEFDIDEDFDRVVSVEMFEHMRNHSELLKRISGWLKPNGKLFVHIFCHKELTYEFVDRGDDDWMSRHFFSGGIMPAADFLGRFNDHLSVEEHWTWDGTHYQKTCEAWLKQMDANRQEIMPVLISNYGKKEARRWFNRWRMFHLACSELFGFNEGNEWFVSHYRFAKMAERS